ncbi:hypothetical protein J6590_063330 [Homalodisca vitripennis]|nr:hypothetical protein J6590_063330 [Homalodisca vitripennis]
MENEEKTQKLLNSITAKKSKCANYSVGRRSRRWPLVVWYAMMDVSAVNALMILRAAQPTKNVNRQSFLISLGKTLIMAHMRNRVSIVNSSKELRGIIRKCMGSEELDREERGLQQPKKR